LTEEHRLRVFLEQSVEEDVGHKREQDASWRKLHNDELHSLCSSPNVRVIKSRMIRCIGEERDVYMVLVGRPEGK
jgi:hypothetical protein